MHINSGVDYVYLEQVYGAMVCQVLEFGQGLQAISTGGGFSTPYQRGEEAINTEHYYSPRSAARKQITRHLSRPMGLETEPGRFLVAQAGVLVTQMWSVRQVGSYHFMLVDAGSNDLVRPTIYGSHHRISALTAEDHSLKHAPTVETIITGPLYEPDDVFAQQEEGNVEAHTLSEMKTGDYLVLHDTGTYGTSMSFNYNNRPLLPEVLFGDDQVRLICCHQTTEELLALGLP